MATKRVRLKKGTDVLHPETELSLVTGAQSAIDAVDTKAGNALTTADEAYELADGAKSRADAAYSLAEGKSKAYVFDTETAMTTALKGASATDYKIGDNLLIKASDTPDYWISGVLSENTGVYGYYQISVLESEKVDLTEYAKTADLENGSVTVAKATKATQDGSGNVITATYATKNDLSSQWDDCVNQFASYESVQTIQSNMITYEEV